MSEVPPACGACSDCGTRTQGISGLECECLIQGQARCAAFSRDRHVLCDLYRDQLIQEEAYGYDTRQHPSVVDPEES